MNSLIIWKIYLLKKNKTNTNYIVNTKLKSWIKPLYTLILVAIPSIFMWVYLGWDFRPKDQPPPLNIWYIILIVILFIFVIILITLILIYFKILPLSILPFIIPILISFMAIFLSSWLHEINQQWYRALIIIPSIFTVIPVNIFLNKYERKQLIKSKIK